jgi:hypothetical protein
MYFRKIAADDAPSGENAQDETAQGETAQGETAQAADRGRSLGDYVPRLTEKDEGLSSLVGLIPGVGTGTAVAAQTALDPRSDTLSKNVADAGTRGIRQAAGPVLGGLGGAAAGGLGGAALLGIPTAIATRNPEAAVRAGLMGAGPGMGAGGIAGGLYGLYRGGRAGRRAVDKKYNEDGSIRPGYFGSEGETPKKTASLTYSIAPIASA